MHNLTEDNSKILFENFLNSFQQLINQLESKKELFNDFQNEFFLKYQKASNMLNKLYDAFLRMDERNKKLALLNFINLLETQKLTVEIFSNVVTDDTSILENYINTLLQLSEKLLPYLEEFQSQNKK